VSTETTDAAKQTEASAAGLLLAIAATAVGYYVAGRLGLLLAIPPGYATAVWPASGLALAAVLLRGYGVIPGVWLGSLAINAPTALAEQPTADPLEVLLLPALIGLGASLQALVGTALVRRRVGERNILEQEVGVVPLLLLGGPLSCLISATCGVGVLYLNGHVLPQDALFNWWTWWVGDSIGVLIFTPLVLIWALRPRSRWLGRSLAVTLPLMALFGAVVSLFVYVSGLEQARLEEQVRSWARNLTVQVEHALESRANALTALQGFYRGSNEVTPEEFQVFTNLLMQRRGAMLGFSWDPWIEGGAQRAHFEREMQDHLPGFRIFEFGGNGAHDPAAERPFYLPVAYMAPAPENAMVPGLDVISEPARKAVVLDARDNGHMALTEPVTLLQHPERGPGVLMFAPVYRNGVPIDTVEQRRQHFLGAVAAVFRPSELIPLARAQQDQLPFNVTMTDVTDPQRPLGLYGRLDGERPPGLSEQTEIGIGGRVWRLEFSLPEEYLRANRPWEVWILLAAGMLFTGLLGMFLLLVVGRDARVAHLVEERTNQLQEANRGLAREAARSDRLETESRARAEQLAATNRELEQFAFVVSHDLQAPLRNIQSFIKLLNKRHSGALSGEAIEFMGFIRDAAADMERMITDLLQLSRVNPKRAQMDSVRMGEALSAALVNLRTDLEAKAAQVAHGELPEVRGDARLLTQLFQNLVGNAIKFHRPGHPPRVRIDAALVSGEWKFTVADNGIGISEKDAGRLFQVFKRLHTAEEYPGTGIGLALCKKIVNLHGGRIWLESRPGEGSTFYFTLPLQGTAAPEP
jgi:signal transduction histidine kinase/integral membrane sensor domain MASE1